MKLNSRFKFELLHALKFRKEAPYDEEEVAEGSEFPADKGGGDLFALFVGLVRSSFKAVFRSPRCFARYVLEIEI